MTNAIEINNDYREWLISTATDFIKSAMQCEGILDYSDCYSTILNKIFDTEFYSKIEHDDNRKADAFGMRFRFSDWGTKYTYRDVYNYLVAPVNLLEIMVSLSLRIDEEITGDPRYESNAFMWFYAMMENTKFIELVDFNYEEAEALLRISTILNRTYSPNGEGGLFKVSKRGVDLRKVELWYQMLWYLDEVYE